MLWMAFRSVVDRLFGPILTIPPMTPSTPMATPRPSEFVDDARRRLTKATRAVFPVHWLGLPCPMGDLIDFADRHGLIVLEDAAHAHGASLDGKRMGAWGRISIFSYQTTKPLPALEGGMGVYQNRDDYERAAAFGNSDVARYSHDGTLQWVTRYMELFGDPKMAWGYGTCVREDLMDLLNERNQLG